MSGLDPRFILAYTFGKYFSDKTTGQPLSGGYILFYEDEARTIPKDVYILSGGPINYIYTNIGSRVDISFSGMPIYQNDNIAIYFFPYQGTPDDSNSIVQLYFYEVFDAGGNSQFTREGQPNNVNGSIIVNGTVAKNYAPNGQMVLHYDLPATDIGTIYQEGEIRPQPGANPGITPLAYGGWSFQRDASSTSDDFALFEISSFAEVTDTFPRFDVTLRCTSPDASDLLKDWSLTFDDVNKFSSATQAWTYNFTGISNTGGNVSVQLFLIKNYGTNGSPETSNLLTTFTLTPTETQFNHSFVFGLNTGMTIDEVNNDDFLVLALRRSTSSISDITIGNFILGEGTITSPIIFPATTTREFIYESITPEIPSYSGFDLYLPRILTMNGEVYDHSGIGRVESATGLPIDYDLNTGFHNSANLLMAFGQQFETISYSPLGIPMGRLQANYFDSTLNTPIYGTGLSFATAYYPIGGTQIVLTNNSPGAVTNIADTGATGFTVANIHTGAASGYYAKVYMTDIPVVTTDPATFYIEARQFNATNNTPAPNAATSGFTVGGLQDDFPDTRSIDFVTVSAVPTHSTYFTFGTTNAGTSVGALWQPWFKVDGVGSAPIVVSGYTLIEIDLLSTDTPTIVAEKIRESLNGWQVSTIVVVTPPPASSYFEFTTISPTSTTQLYVVWYTINNVGTKPVITNAIYIKVALLSTDTAALIASKTQKEINSKYFAIPDYRNAIPRWWNNGKVTDEDVSQRFSLVPGVIGDMVGTYQNSDNLDHQHWGSLERAPDVGLATVDPVGAVELDTLGGAGDTLYVREATGLIYDNPLKHFESRPVNFFVNPVIRY